MIHIVRVVVASAGIDGYPTSWGYILASSITSNIRFRDTLGSRDFACTIRAYMSPVPLTNLTVTGVHLQLLERISVRCA